MQHVVWLKDLFNKVKGDNIVEFQLALIPEPTSPAIFKWENIDRRMQLLPFLPLELEYRWKRRP